MEDCTGNCGGEDMSGETRSDALSGEAVGELVRRLRDKRGVSANGEWRDSDCQKAADLIERAALSLASVQKSLEREEVAQIIYETMPFDGRAAEKPPWIPGGNSWHQDEARRAADRILALFRSSTVTAPPPANGLPTLDEYRNNLVEECAKIAEPWSGFIDADRMGTMDKEIIKVRDEIAAAIRSLSVPSADRGGK